MWQWQVEETSLAVNLLSESRSAGVLGLWCLDEGYSTKGQQNKLISNKNQREIC